MSKAKKEFIENMKRVRNIDFAQIGMMVEVDSHVGTIKGMNNSGNIDVVFANQLKFGKHAASCHPTWRIKYFDMNGTCIAEYKEQPLPNRFVG